jgi:undecaprenyl-diphosphatase
MSLMPLSKHATRVVALREHLGKKPSAGELRLFDLIHHRGAHPLLDRCMPTFTLLGLGGVQLPLVGLLCWATWADQGKTLWWTALAAFLLTTAVVHLIKRRVNRKRPVKHVPIRRLVPITRAGSFPSGHTACSFALATVVAWYFPLWAVPLLLAAAAIGYSRIYVGVHFSSDVLVAALIGLACGSAIMAWAL